MKHLIGNAVNGLAISDEVVETPLQGKELFLIRDGVATEIEGKVIKHVTCKHDTSYFGDTLNLVRVFNTPYGVVESNYRCWGAGLEYARRDWRLVAEAEIEALAKRAQEAAKLAGELAQELAAYRPK